MSAGFSLKLKHFVQISSFMYCYHRGWWPGCL